MQLLEREGAGALTLDRIASEAGLSKGGLLYHFSGKEQLVEALVERAVGALSQAPKQRARDVFGAVLAAYSVDPSRLDPLRKAFRSANAGSGWLASEGLALFEYLGLVKEKFMSEVVAVVPSSVPAPPVQVTSDMRARARKAAEIAAQNLLAQQDQGGFWRGNLTADTTLESDYVLLNLWLYPATAAGWQPAHRERIDKAMATIVDRQLADGGWNIYPTGPSELNATVRAYSALKICGHDPASAVMKKARERILALGGMQAANSYTKINLSLFGLFPREYAPSVPPELRLIPGNLIYEMSSWTRANHRAALDHSGERSHSAGAARCDSD